MPTTKLKFSYVKKDFFQIVENWAEEYGYKLKESEGNHRVYKKGGLLYLGDVNCPELDIIFQNGHVTLECWFNTVAPGKLIIFPLWSMFSKKEKADLGTNSSYGHIAKNKMREEINDLLTRLGQKNLPKPKYNNAQGFISHLPKPMLFLIAGIIIITVTLLLVFIMIIR